MFAFNFILQNKDAKKTETHGLPGQSLHTLPHNIAFQEHMEVNQANR